MTKEVVARDYFPGMGSAVADRTINRKITLPDGTTRTETWAEVADRVALGNALLIKPRIGDAVYIGADGRELTMPQKAEYEEMRYHLRQASLLMSGRHLQHGDETQPERPQEVFTNCLEFSEKILTMEYGPIEIGKISGQVVTVIAGDGQPRSATINAHGEQELFEITFRGAKGGCGNYRKKVVATRDHRWLLRDGSVTTSLAEGDVLKAITGSVKRDPEAVVHGLVFGDGAAHKGRRDNGRPGVSQGRTYASIRVCKQDAVQAEIHRILDDAGYSYTTPPSADNDRVYYIGKFAHAKELPFTNDPEYIAGFLYGWWLADGSKSYFGGMEITTSDEQAARWLDDYAGYAGYNVTLNRVQARKENDGSYANGKSLHTRRLREGVEWKVESVIPAGRGHVFCPEEPVTSSFVLANGLLTGNCSTSATTFLLFYLLLNGSGVGRAYDDAMIKADLNNMPIVVPVIDWSHADVESGKISGYKTANDARHLYKDREITVFNVPDSREGWAKAVEIIERMAFEKRRDEVLIIDFTGVRPHGAPIKGMQNRPASGPGPLMAAIANIATLRDAGMAPWRAAIYADHYAAECVLVGGARRAARMATKHWKDPTIFDFIELKRGGFLWSSNNSVTIDEEFRAGATKVRQLYKESFTKPTNMNYLRGLELTNQVSFAEAHAYRVLLELAQAAYFDGTGEPGIINQDRLTQNDEGFDGYTDGLYAESARFQVDKETVPLMADLAKTVAGLKYTMITNPCGEITLLMLGAYCVIADVVPFHAASVIRKNGIGPVETEMGEAAWDDDAEDAFRTAVRALIRVNTMDCLYRREVNRTNRIGVGITGFHEWAYARFGFAWQDLVDEKKSAPLWLTMSRFKRAIVDEAQSYSKKLGVAVPHTNTTFKPAGTTSKLFGLTEGAHLPSMREFLRWVQFRNDDPLIADYEKLGYPVKRLKTYSGTTVVGFPTKPKICELDGGAWVTTAAEATPEEQYEFLRLLEKYWIRGVEIDGITPLAETGNQVSYTLKYDPKSVTFDRFLDTLVEGQFSIRCCSVMPQSDSSAYEYLPEQPVDKLTFEKIAQAINQDAGVQEDVDFEHVDCSSGACPVDFHKNASAA